MSSPSRILYCHCAYAQVVPAEVKNQVLAQLSESGVAFDAVPDLCEMSARRDPKLKELAADGAVKIAACYPRAVTWLFSAADAPLPAEGATVLNMRVDPAATIVAALLGSSLEGASPASALPGGAGVPPSSAGEGEAPAELPAPFNQESQIQNPKSDGMDL